MSINRGCTVHPLVENTSKLTDINLTANAECMLSNLEIVHMCYTISRLPVQSRDSENVQHNLEIAQILRLSGTYIIS